MAVHLGLHRGRYVLDVPDLLQEPWQFAVLQLEREAHLRVLVAQRSELRQDRQQFGEYHTALRIARVPIQDVDPQRVDVVALDVLDQFGLLQSGPIREDDYRREECVLDVVYREGEHLPAEVQQVLYRVRHAGHPVGVPRVGPVVREQDRIGGSVVAAGHSQHHNLA